MIEIGSDEWKALLAYMHMEELDPDGADAALLRSMYGAAERYLARAGVAPEVLNPDNPGEDELYRLTLRYLTLDMFDHRGTEYSAAAAGAVVGVREWINQLKACVMEGYL